ncbi:UDP-glucose/GDP-mannose dehydrogenase family protein [Saccharopolyspora sp. HNM0986]|uniref:UDP-glucose dehydrogenase family protein n=1 Tax=Saccharopolyspora galaxeae TaxID=2781241 RepID=UPI00190CF73F|nr:UDP-glucose/GDP-mannose dehydrogenase family protein [Saccharopolyspora sp. HNM0986]MBK0865365.1 UDP-glucose/GDP-mannose dehydrogenase family protein [Saccharopolyspora sp. HNM0986]
MFARRIVVVGTGYVGLTTGACLASLGHRVVCSDVDAAKVARLSRGEVGILEPGLAELVAEGIAAGRLEFAVGSAGAVVDAEVVFLCVPTPMGADGAADLAAVESVVSEVACALPTGCVLVCKSTVPVGTSARVAELVGRPDVPTVSNPEFLREGSAVHDFLNPDRIVVGSDSQDAAERVAALYARLGAPTVLTDAASAELVKYAANCFLATKLSYVNAVAELCERLGANISDVTEGMGYDRRIGQSFLQPGPGWGGSCLPKDTAAMMRVASSVGFEFELLGAAIDSNARQRERVVDKVADACGEGLRRSLEGVRLGLLGLTFKAGTDDLRDSPALAVAELLAARGAELVACDPGLCGDEPGLQGVVSLVDDPYEAAKGSAGLVVLTEWPQFRALEWPRVAGLLAGPVVVDTRNHLDPDMLRRAGITCHGAGRVAVG